MRERWQPVIILAGGLFLINVIARFVAWQLIVSNEKNQLMIGLIAMGAVAAVLVGAGYRWALRYPVPRLAGDLSVAIAVACVLSIGLGPFAGGSVPGREGAAFVIAEIWHYLVLCAGGAIFGLLVAMMLGRDHTSQGWKRYAETVRARPHRPVRR